MSMINDPKVAQIVGQNPNANGIKNALMAHVMEHVGFQYRRGVEQQLGAALPSPEQKLPPQVEAQLAKLTAEAAQRLVQANQATAAQQTAQQQAQDPIVQMQQKELQLKEQEIQDKKLIELEKIKAQKEIAMLNNEAKLLLQNEDQKIEALFKGFDAANAQQDMQVPGIAGGLPPNQAAPTQPPVPPVPPQPMQ